MLIGNIFKRGWFTLGTRGHTRAHTHKIGSQIGLDIKSEMLGGRREGLMDVPVPWPSVRPL